MNLPKASPPSTGDLWQGDEDGLIAKKLPLAGAAPVASAAHR